MRLFTAAELPDAIRLSAAIVDGRTAARVARQRGDRRAARRHIVCVAVYKQRLAKLGRSV